MAHPVISKDDCSACGICVDSCPEGVLVLDLAEGVALVAEEDDCTACGTCLEECPMGAIEEIVED
jgi:NAD-dependent dihydropyrimidine dehydrogenase PreA subunit